MASTLGSYLHHVATTVPEVAYEQDFVCEVMKDWLGPDRRTERLLHRVYTHSGIERRHSVVDDFLPGAPGGLFHHPVEGFRSPTTGARNELYTSEARRLYGCLAREAVADCPGIEVDDITHVVTVSCTGFFAPGPDYVVVRALGLPGSTQRYHLGFMGCYAAFPALRMADAFCRADPEAVVLIVCLELCTLHLQPTRELDSILSTSVFADGGAAAIVSARSPHPDASALEVKGFASSLSVEGEADMAWTVGDHGFDMVLSSYVPAIVESSVAGAIAPLIDPAAVGAWAVHPGGRAILDKVERGLGLAPDALDASRGVLQEYGNMSSATVLFVLKRLLEDDTPASASVAALAFGPGLTVESGLFERV